MAEHFSKKEIITKVSSTASPTFVYRYFSLFLVETVPGHQAGQQEVSAPLTLWSALWSQRRLPYEHHGSSQHYDPCSFVHHFVPPPRLHRSGFPHHCCPSYHYKVDVP